MKKILLAFCIAFICLTLKTQTYNYTISSQPYEALEDATDLELEENWDDPEVFFLQPPPFPIRFFGGEPAETIVFDGFFDLSFIGTNLNFSFFSGGGYDLVYKQDSKIRYKITGTAPNRIIKVEMVNVSLFNSNDEIDFFNGQLWIHEDGCFSSHIGSFQANPEDMSFGLFVLISSVAGKAVFIKGTLSDNSLLEIDFSPGNEPNFEEVSLDGIPTENTFFQFCPSEPTFIKESSTISSFDFYPNPAVDFITVNTKGNLSIERLEIYTIDGRLCFQSNFDVSKSGVFNISELNSGSYILQLHNSKGETITRKLLKQ